MTVIDTARLEWVRHITGASQVVNVQTVQSLWSGYGVIARVQLAGAPWPTVVVKQVSPPVAVQHPRGWHSEIGHQRKLQSYQVEWHWYQNVAQRCPPTLRMPAFIGADVTATERTLVLEDLDAEFPRRFDQVNVRQLIPVLQWLATFHACFLGDTAEGLWSVGSYWHLQTRPDEWQRMPQGRLKQAAEALDQRLRRARFQTLIHGDAKLANVCFSADAAQVAGVDFQYVGRGCGVIDVMYLLTSALSETDCVQHEAELLDSYFSALRAQLAITARAVDVQAVEQEWRTLYPVAWADFHRFLAGWSPQHWKINAQMAARTEAVLDEIGA